MKNISVTCSSN